MTISVSDASRQLINTVLLAEPALLAISLSDALLRPSPGKWSKIEIIGHLIDSACNNQQKFIRTQLAEGGHLDFTGYAQDAWVAVQQYQHMHWPQVIALWKHYNLHLAHVMAVCPADKHHHTISVNGAPPCRLDFIMNDYVAHLEHHLAAVFPALGSRK